MHMHIRREVEAAVSLCRPYRCRLCLRLCLCLRLWLEGAVMLAVMVVMVMMVVRDL